ADYLNHLLDLGVAGFRIDAAKHMPADDLAAILSRLKRPSYALSETFIGYNEPVSFEEYLPFSDINFFPYTFDIGAAFNHGYINNLPNLFNFYPDSLHSIVFLENHDTQRIHSSAIPSYDRNPNIYKLAHVFFLTWPYGYPQLFSGY